jgi:protein ImuA
MGEAIKAAQLALLRQRLAQLERGGRIEAALPFGAVLDRALPGGGLACGALHEVGSAGIAEEEGAEAAAFLAGILARLDPPRPVLWCSARGDLYAPGLAAHGLPADRLILARARNAAELLRTMEEGLRCPALAAVVGEVPALSLAASRRLQLAAENSGVTAFVLCRRTVASTEALRPLAALTRWRIAALPSRPDAGEPGLGRPLWSVELLRCRGGVPAQWVVEACDATGHVHLAEELADRPAAAARIGG